MPRRTHTETWWAAATPHVLRCVAHLKSDGSRCRSEATSGTTVCDRHGALAPAVQAAAATRIQMSVDEAARQLVDWMNDSAVDMRERVKIAHDLLDRGGLAATQKHLIGVGQVDSVERLFLDILSDPNALADPNAAPPARSAEFAALNRAALTEGPEWDDVVDAEVVEAVQVEQARPTSAQIAATQRPTGKRSSTPKHIRKAMEELL